MEELLNRLSDMADVLIQVAHENELARIHGKHPEPLAKNADDNIHNVQFSDDVMTRLAAMFDIPEDDIRDTEPQTVVIRDTEPQTVVEKSEVNPSSSSDIGNAHNVNTSDVIDADVSEPSDQPEVDETNSAVSSTTPDTVPDQLTDHEMQLFERLPLSAKEVILAKLNITFSKDKRSWSQKVANGVIYTLLQVRTEETITFIRDELKRRNGSN